MKRLIISLVVSVVASVILLVGAAMADGACHCMTSMYSLFPYGTYVSMHFSVDSLGLPLILLQFPLYVLVVTLVKGMRWKIGVLLFLIAMHVLAASFSLHDYCQSRRNCFLERHQTSTFS